MFEPHKEWLFRFVGVLGILDGCGSVLIPVLYKLGGKSDGTTPSGSLDRIELSCPRCGHRETYPVGTIRCGKCSLEIQVEITKESPACLPNGLSRQEVRMAFLEIRVPMAVSLILIVLGPLAAGLLLAYWSGIPDAP